MCSLTPSSVAASDPNPSDPFRGLYISDDLALFRYCDLPGMMGRVAALSEAASLSALLVAPFAGAALASAPAFSLYASSKHAVLA